MNKALTQIAGFAGELIRPGDAGFDTHREVWNAMVDRHPALIARCTSASDVAAAVRHGREAGLEIAVKCGGHSMTGISVPEGGLMIDLSPMSEVRVDPQRRRATVQGGSLLRNLDRAAEPHGLATTAGNVSHTGVGGLTLGGGMGWLARQFGMACDNVVAYTVVTAHGETLRATADENPDLFFALRGGGGNFGIVTEFEFRLHPISHTVLAVDRFFDPADAPAALRTWRDLLPDAPRQATLTADANTAAATSAAEVQRAISAGRRSTIAFQTSRCSSNAGSPGCTTSPANPGIVMRIPMLVLLGGRVTRLAARR